MARVISADRVAAGIGGVVLANSREVNLKIVDKISRTSTVIGLVGGETPKVSNLKLVVSDFHMENNISGYELLHKSAVLKDVKGDIPFIFMSPNFADKVNNADVGYSNGEVLVVDSNKRNAGNLLWYMSWRCKAISHTFNCLEAVEHLKKSGSAVKLVIADVSVVTNKRAGDALLAQVSRLGIPFVAMVPIFADSDVINRLIDAGALMLLLEPYNEVYSLFLVSLMDT